MSTPATQDNYNIYMCQCLKSLIARTEHLEEVRGIMYSLYYEP